MENVKILNVDDSLAFQSHYAFMSNMFGCLIKADGNIYQSAEHIYLADLAKYHNRNNLIQPIIVRRADMQPRESYVTSNYLKSGKRRKFK